MPKETLETPINSDQKIGYFTMTDGTHCIWGWEGNGKVSADIYLSAIQPNLLHTFRGLVVPAETSVDDMPKQIEKVIAELG